MGTLSLSYRESQVVRQTLNLHHTIALVNYLSLPPGALDAVINAIALNPEKMDGIMKQLPETKRSGGVKALIGKLSPSSNTGSDATMGFILTTGLESIVEIVGRDSEIKVVPDVMYTGKEKKEEKPDIKLAGHLSPKLELSLQAIPNKYKGVKQLYKSLARQREWINDKLRSLYLIIGSEQREFINTGDITDIHSLGLDELARSYSDRLGLSISSISRLRTGRYAEIKSFDGRMMILPVKALLANRFQSRKYQQVGIINSLFRDESERKIAYSDREICAKLRLARRTMAKYRVLAGIPPQWERTEIYKENPSKVYAIPALLTDPTVL